MLALKEGGAALVICPASVKGVWLREAQSWRPDLRPVILNGRKSFRFPTKGEIIITNYDILDGTKTSLPPTKLDVIFDEVHVLKSPATLRTKTCDALATAVLQAGGRTYGLTGTPMLNNPPEFMVSA